MTQLHLKKSEHCGKFTAFCMSAKRRLNILRRHLDPMNGFCDKSTQEFVADWDRKFSELVTDEMHERICGNAKQIYVLMREICPILDMLIVEENFHRPLTIEFRERLARMLRDIDGSEANHG